VELTHVVDLRLANAGINICVGLPKVENIVPHDCSCSCGTQYLTAAPLQLTSNRNEWRDRHAQQKKTTPMLVIERLELSVKFRKAWYAYTGY